MKIAVIGGSGFVGSRLISLLKDKEGIDLLNVDKSDSSMFPEITTIVNILDKDRLSKALVGVDVVVLLAAEHRDDVTPISLYYDVNVKGMENTLLAMEQNNVKRLIFTSSVAIYGLGKSNPDEQAKVAPFNDYGRSKWQAERCLQRWHALHQDWNINIIRPTVIFGESNRGNVYNLLRQIASGRFVMIGDGNNQKSMAYIGNVVAFIAFLIQQNKPGYHIYNYADKPDFTTKELVTHTASVLRKKVPTIRIPYRFGLFIGYCFDFLAFLTRKKLTISSIRVKKFCAVTQYSGSKALASGFAPPFTLAEGLRNTLQAEFINDTEL